MNGDFVFKDKVFRILATMLWISLILALAVLTVQPANAAPPSPNVPCEETCTYQGRTVFCNSSVCGGRDYVIQRFWCCDPCVGCYPRSNDVCMDDPYCG